jgi:hypothetical protein
MLEIVLLPPRFLTGPRGVLHEYDEAQENERPEAGCLVAQSVFYTVCQSAPGVLLIFLIQLRY